MIVCGSAVLLWAFPNTLWGGNAHAVFGEALSD